MEVVGSALCRTAGDELPEGTEDVNDPECSWLM